ncbi:vanadium-dependent haloperoxidase [Urbifossiella limnaea]|uniref:PAP2 superfamily protein n=1 Tax=Urbifossiella limnaea TaxID=2528023 RepID=A0A517XPI2_9BACT|nr:vanadium-dependent haloperoxidase [Urbifossiella limnaea]QDU19420.1 PAP2 superfamily protein [Urbifossiella limnaea]
MRWLALGLLAVVAGVGPGRSAGTDPGQADSCPTDPVGRWNEATLRAVRAERTPPPVAARNLAVVHLAVHDAVAATVATVAPFRVRYVARVDADPAAAAGVAAHRVLAELYPARVAEFDAALDATLDPVPEGPARTRGVALGQATAEAVLRWRAADGVVARRSDYRPRQGLGLWRPTPDGYRPPLLPGWGRVAGFAVADPAAFRPPPPPAVGTPEYERAYAEVAALGRADSPTRTRDQTEVAHFWADGDGTVTPPGHWNRIAQAVAADRRLTLADAARLFAVLNAAMADAAVVCWDCKYRFDVWRPVTAVRETDPAWSPLLPTPPFPAYTSGHSSFSGAAAAALAAFFGTDEVAFATTSDGLPRVTRTFRRLSAAAEEAGMSRVYGGIHWQFDNTAGLRCGREVGVEVARRFGLPARGPGGAGLPPPVVEEVRGGR